MGTLKTDFSITASTIFKLGRLILIVFSVQLLNISEIKQKGCKVASRHVKTAKILSNKNFSAVYSLILSFVLECDK